MLIPLILFSTLLAFNIIRSKSFLNLYSFLLFFYLTAAWIGLYINKTSVDLSTVFAPKAMGYLTFALLLFIWPWKKYNRLSRMKILVSSETKIKKIAMLLIIGNGLIILYYLFDVISLLRGDINAARIQKGVEWQIGINANIQSNFDLVAEFFAQYLSYTFFILIALYFYYLNKSTLLSRICLITSLSIIIKHLANIGRTGFILWILMYICCYLIFRSHLTRKNAATIMKQVIALFSVFIAIYTIISISRFGHNEVPKYRSTSEALLDYYSQGYRNFNTFYDLKYDDLFYGEFHFPLVFGVVEKIGLINYDNREILDHIKDMQPETWNTFNTFIADLWNDFGQIGVLMFGVLYAVIVVGIIYNQTGISLGAIFLILYMIQLPLFGLFSSTWKMPESNFVMFLIMGLMVYLRPKKY